MSDRAKTKRKVPTPFTKMPKKTATPKTYELKLVFFNVQIYIAPIRSAFRLATLDRSLILMETFFFSLGEGIKLRKSS